MYRNNYIQCSKNRKLELNSTAKRIEIVLRQHAMNYLAWPSHNLSSITTRTKPYQKMVVSCCNGYL
jgi:hypothetical protein